MFADDVDHSLEKILGADRDQNRVGVGSELGTEFAHRFVKVGTGTVHLIDKSHPWDVVFGGLAPYRLGLWLDTGDAAINQYHAVQHPEGALDLGREIHVTWSVDDIHPHLFPFKHFEDSGIRELLPLGSDSSGSDGDTTLFFLLHPVGSGSAIVDFTDAVDHARVEQDTLRQRRLPGIDMRGDPDIPGALQRICAVRTVAGIRHWTGESEGKKVNSGTGRVEVTTSGNERRRGWLEPSCAHRRACGRHYLGWCWRP